MKVLRILEGRTVGQAIKVLELKEQIAAYHDNRKERKCPLTKSLPSLSFSA